MLNYPLCFDGEYTGKRGFIIGGGPSILMLQEQGFDFADRLKDEVVIGVNKAYKLLKPNFLVFIDLTYHRKYKDEVEQLKCIKFLNKSCGYRDETTFPLDAYGGYTDKVKNLVPTGLNEPISLWNNSGVAALRIAYLLGLNPIYLVGIDLCVYNNKSHFHDDYHVSPKFYPAKRFVRCFKDTIRLLEEKGVKIYSCSSISELNGTIPYVDLTTLL